MMADGVTIKWNVTGSGESAIGTYRATAKPGLVPGRLYFLKRNNTILFPDESKLRLIFKDEETLRKVVDKKTKPFKELRDKQNDMIKLMKDIDFDRDHVAREILNFRDSENHFVTVTPIVPNGVSRNDFDYTTISKDAFLDLAKQMAKEIEVIHRSGVVHSDIKMDNYVYSNKTVPYLIDFDISFPAAKVPANGEIGGTEGHISPEVLTYRNEKTEEFAAKITPKIDIFSLAITLHFLWAGELPPTNDGKSVGEALIEGKPYRLSDKFNFAIPGKGVKFSDLLRKMLDMNPANRPSAETLCKILNGECGLDDAGGEDDHGDDDHDTHEDPPGRVEVSEITLNKTSLEMKVGDGSITLIANVMPTDATDRRVTWTSSDPSVASVSNGVVMAIKPGEVTITAKAGEKTATCAVKVEPKPVEAEVCEPWPVDKIALVDVDTLKAKGYTKLRRSIREGGYLLTYASGLVMAHSKDSLIALGLASKSGTTEDDRLWPEDVAAGYEIDETVVRRMAIKEIRKTEGADGSHNYTLVYLTRTQLVSSKLFALMGIMKK